MNDGSPDPDDLRYSNLQTRWATHRVNSMARGENSDDDRVGRVLPAGSLPARGPAPSDGDGSHQSANAHSGISRAVETKGRNKRNLRSAIFNLQSLIRNPQSVIALQWTLPAISLLILGIAGRLLPHPPNFTPLAAIALFGGFFFRDLRWAVAVPLAALIVSDAFLGTYDLRIMAVVYAGLFCPVLLRGWLRARLTAGRVVCSAALISLLFFVSSNFAVWAFSGMYAPTLSGLLACYVAATPFLKYTLAGNLIYSAAIFGVYSAVSAFVVWRNDVGGVPCSFRWRAPADAGVGLPQT